MWQEGDRVMWRYGLGFLRGYIDHVCVWNSETVPIGYKIQWDNGEYGTYLPGELVQEPEDNVTRPRRKTGD